MPPESLASPRARVAARRPRPGRDAPRLAPRLASRAALRPLALGAALIGLGALLAPGAGRADAGATAPTPDRPIGRLVLEPSRAHRGAEGGTTPAPSALDAIALDATLELEVAGLLAELRLVQRFENATDEWRDGAYAFPMPEGATLLGLEIRVGERTILGEVVEREAANGAFEAAAAAGQVAAVVDVERPNLFRTRIASIGPRERVTVALEVLLPVEVDAGEYRLALPTTLTPRYVNASVPDPDRVRSPVAPASAVRGPRVRLEARVAGTDPARIASPTHRLVVDGDAAALEAPADRDVLLRWPGHDGSDPAVRVHGAVHAGERYVQLLLEPPGTAEGATAPARELILVLDRSGSMAGEPIRAARAAVDAALDRLGPRDAFNVIAFDDGLAWAFDRARPATPDALAEARRFVRRLDADGGTEIRPALERALATSAGESGDGGGRLVQIVFVTDGAIGYEDALLADIERGLGARRLFSVGIGAAPNRWFLERAAEAGRGTATFVTDVQGVETGIGRLLETLSTPVLTDLAASPTAGSMTLYPDPLPDLYAGRPVMLVARVDDAVGEIVVTGDRAGARWRRTFRVPAADAPGTDAPGADAPAVDTPLEDRARSAPAIASRWAAARIDHLLDAGRRANDPERHRDEIVALALAAGAASPYTSFVAIEERVARPANAMAVPTDVPNLAPAGTLLRPIAMPSGALGLGAARERAALLAAAAAAFALGHAGLARRRRARALPATGRAA